ncbi:MAG: FliI/YscN family ATPase [Anaerohalosphaera sp.]|nr:FliI/YscN family ATPase [Anaerohalosphaera sp.]
MQAETGPYTIDFEKFHAALNGAKLSQGHGAVVRVSGLVVESNGPLLGLGELCSIHLRSNKKALAEVIGFQNKNLLLLPLEHIDGISPGDAVTAKFAPRYISLGQKILGRVLNGLGEPIDNKGPLEGADNRRLDSQSIPPMDRKKISQPLPLGIRAIDSVLALGKGQRVGIFAGSGVGKSVLLGDIANSTEADVNVVALIGERGREVREFIEENLGPEGLSRSVVIVATSDSPAIQRVKAAFVAATIAEYFRDMGKDVLFMMDSLTRFAQAQREIGLAAGEPPASKGYCPSVFAMMPRFIERLGCGSLGSITGILTVLAESDDLNDPVADSARSLLDGHIVLSRQLADRGHFPAVDILKSVSRLMPSVVSSEHLLSARKLREIYATYTDAEDLINIGAFASGSNRRIDASVALIDAIRQFLVQPAGQRTEFGQTQMQMMEITQVWDKYINANDRN